MIRQTIAGIRRTPIFSPNHIGNDAAIFNGTADYLREKGYHVPVHTEQEYIYLSEKPMRLFTMQRLREAVRILKQQEEAGCKAVNSAFGIENCGREQMTHLLIEHQIPCPESLIVGTCESLIPLLERNGFSACWLKRADFHAIHREDVTYARHPEEAQEMMAEYALRGISRVVINKHLPGDLIKFYGVAGSDFFYWFYPCENSHSKFGHERINGKARGIPFCEEELRDLCVRAAEALKVTIYGGDCIVSPDGALHFIDFNDWPSFAPCRREAIPAIGDMILKITAP
jgi:hypothetical protein